jgi:3-deoxy-D-manno-octulosonate 8-phosphate phosphatase (KDO 8-P phosphatase)
MTPTAAAPPQDELRARAARVELLVLDVDGTLTDGSLFYSDSGHDTKAFHVRDGFGLKAWTTVGRRAAVISGRSSPATQRRAEELGLAPVVLNRPDKLRALRVLLAETGLRPEQMCAVGDDLPDVPLFRNCGLAIAVADATPEAMADAHLVTTARGGHGAVREAVEWLLRAQGLWDGFVERIRGERL